MRSDIKVDEIGSEFWLTALDDDSTTSFWESWDGSQRSFLSGRTALDAIITDILSEKKCVNAYLPSYCCQTMIEPFLRNGLRVDFYDVVPGESELEININADHECDIVLAMDYFGYVRNVKKIFPHGAVVICDVTHTPLHCINNADYVFGSFRKWGPISGAAVASKLFGIWNIKSPEHTNTRYIAMREEAYEKKAQYMKGKSNNKADFFLEFSAAEELLETDYLEYLSDYSALNVAKMIPNWVSRRQENAKILLRGIRNIPEISPVFSTVTEGDTPLFVPVLVKFGKRDALKQFLIENNIYIPVHWPMSNLHQLNSDTEVLYKCELSLVCDQRYDIDDMNRIVDCIRKFFEVGNE